MLVVIIRGIERRKILRDDNDRDNFIHRLSSFCLRPKQHVMLGHLYQTTHIFYFEAVLPEYQL